MNTNRDKLLAYIPLANYINEMNGPRAETLIHDISDYDHSIIYITPKNITGRKVGDCLTDYAIRLISDRAYEQADFVVNYLGRSKANDLILRSSTYFIMDGRQLIGLMCTNIDITEQVKMTEMMRDALLVDYHQLVQKQPLENFSLGTDELIKKVYDKAVNLSNGRKLTVAMKQKIVSELVALDVFLVKGSIMTVAALLNTSEKTIYRYINEEKKRKEKDERFTEKISGKENVIWAK